MNILHFLSHDLMLPILQFFYNISKNYGVAIILLTVAVKVVLYPLTLQSTRQMKAMQKVQPELSKVQEKYKGKPEELQREMMKLYKEHGVNPLGGCLPTLAQLPFFIALFITLTSKEVTALMGSAGAAANSFLWIQDLAKPDNTYLLVLLIGLTTYWTQKMLSAVSSSNPTQQQMAIIMPFFIAFVSFQFPSGVQLYWVVSNLLTILQQGYILKA